MSMLQNSREKPTPSSKRQKTSICVSSPIPFSPLVMSEPKKIVSTTPASFASGMYNIYSFTVAEQVQSIKNSTSEKLAAEPGRVNLQKKCMVILLISRYHIFD